MGESQRENRIVVAIRGDASAAAFMGSSWTSPAQICHGKMAAGGAIGRAPPSMLQVAINTTTRSFAQDWSGNLRHAPSVLRWPRHRRHYREDRTLPPDDATPLPSLSLESTIRSSLVRTTKVEGTKPPGLPSLLDGPRHHRECRVRESRVHRRCQGTSSARGEGAPPPPEGVMRTDRGCAATTRVGQGEGLSPRGS
jgi:hypothetical protein